MKWYILFGLCILLVGSVFAFTVQQVKRSNTYLIGFSDGRNGTAYNVSFNRQANVLSAMVVMDDHRGMTMAEIQEVHSWADSQNGVVGRASTATFNIS